MVQPMTASAVVQRSPDSHPMADTVSLRIVTEVHLCADLLMAM